jgi:flagellar biosynthesis/type III secretory pathway protein FliH
VHANPADLELLTAGLASVDITVVPDPALQPGEARVVGPWAHADLTREAAWAAVREVLDGTG